MAPSASPRYSLSLACSLALSIVSAGCAADDGYLDYEVTATESQPSGPRGIIHLNSTRIQGASSSDENARQVASAVLTAHGSDTTVSLRTTEQGDRLYVVKRLLAQTDSVSIPTLRRWSINGAGGRIDTLPARTVFVGSLHDSLAVVVHMSERRSPRRSTRAYFVSLVDYRGSQVCLDLPLTEIRDRAVHFAIHGDTIVARELPARAPSVANDAGTRWRWQVRLSECPWNYVQGDR